VGCNCKLGLMELELQDDGFEGIFVFDAEVGC